ncbi:MULTISPECIES: SDR family NAD(P)-dependent oxidoreductase [unclassified Amycolatopsis]|uniref:SDR family NAD(P)-dependent oxidoreductase n=1 Tax=unclassified Amycolatopsis TaxID=2618356 RepID=UPI001C69DEA2|nr:SDR family NAD(P)-dependent oxidoreductase [Amycolatopsis sp. DSM 110486]QYN18445.1 SDR family oxidoreductase [Amycolatopsis sp. DSM 110486]
MTAATTEPRVLASGTLDGLSALVTGAGSGIGRAVTQRLVQLGAHVTGLGRHEDSLKETGDLLDGPGGYDHRVCDVRDTEAAAAALVEVGESRGLGLLVNNAGGQFFAKALDISVNGWNSVLDLNLTSIFHLTKAAHPYLARTRGSVVNLSLSGVERGGMGMAHSIAARAGVLGLTRTLALEWATDGIRINCVGPGTVLTHALNDEASEHVLGNLVHKATPMQQPTPTADVAELVAFLASPAGALMTGQLLQIDGGAHLGAGLHMLPEAYR